MAQIALFWRSAASSPHWLWVPVLALGLAAVLAGPMPPGGLQLLARPAVARLLHGSFDVGASGILAALAVAGWMVIKPLAVIAVLLVLELRFNPPTSPQNLTLAWIAQAFATGFLVVILPQMSSGLGFLPNPLFEIDAAGSTLFLQFMQIPALCLSLLVAGFFQYWFHRACHRFGLLWRFHALHHSLELNVLQNITHPLESMLNFLFISVPTALLIRVTSNQLAIIAALV